VIETHDWRFRGAAFGPAALANVVLAAVFFLLSWLSFDFLESRAGMERNQRGWFGKDTWGGVSRVPRFSGNALVWKDCRLFVGGRLGMIIRFVAYGVATIAVGFFYNPLGDDYERFAFGHTVLVLVMVGVVLDLGSLAGRVFRDEIAWQTYSSLLLLPKSILQISYGKVMGCLTAVMPALVFLVIGMLCSYGEVLLMLGPLVLVFVALMYLLLPLIVYMSLWLQRGAFPLTIFGFSLVGFGLYLLLQASPQGLCCFGLLLVALTWRAGAKIHEKILKRLSELSGCDV
jgi:hypothetical protein